MLKLQLVGGKVYDQSTQYIPLQLVDPVQFGERICDAKKATQEIIFNGLLYFYLAVFMRRRPKMGF